MAATRQGHNVRAASVSSSELFTELEELALPFLRSAVLFFHHFTDVAPGQDLVEDGGYTYEVLARWVLKSHGAVQIGLFKVPWPPWLLAAACRVPRILLPP